MAKICIKCGKSDNPDNVRFCLKCGSMAFPANQSPRPIGVQPIAPQPVTPQAAIRQQVVPPRPPASPIPPQHGTPSPPQVPAIPVVLPAPPIAPAMRTIVTPTSGGSNPIPPPPPSSVPAPIDLSHYSLVRIGRQSKPSPSPSNEDTISLPYPTISWHHALIVRQAGNTYILKDLNSTNGTYHGNSANGTYSVQRLHGEVKLEDGSVIRIGPYLFQLQGSILFCQLLQQLQLDGRNLFKDVIRVVHDSTQLISLPRREQETILHDVNITIKPGEFIALLGCSGSGKTTLLNALCGYSPPTRGEVLLGGKPYAEQLDLFRSSIGYVPQDDIVHLDLTVAEVMSYAAQLRLPQDTPDNERQKRIDEVLDALKIGGNIKAKTVAKLSGGQRKRVSIAVELLNSPSFLFLDEPTSGLDPGMEEEVMKMLTDLKKSGCSIVLVTHRLDYIDQCDYVAIIAKQGYLAYFGPMREAPDFFNLRPPNTRPEEAYPRIYQKLEEDNPADAERRKRSYEASSYYGKYSQGRMSPSRAAVTQIASPRPAARTMGLAQWLTLTHRYATTLLKDGTNLAIKALLPIAIALLLLLISQPNGGAAPIFTYDAPTGTPIASMGDYTKAQILLFGMALSVVFFGVFNAIREIVAENAIYKRERMLTIRVAPYVLSKLAVLGLISIAQSVLLLIPIVLLGGLFGIKLPAQGAILPLIPEMLVTLSLCAVAASALGLLASALLTHQQQASTILPLLVIPQLLLSKALNPQLPGFAEFLNGFTVSGWGLSALANSMNLNHVDNNPFFTHPLYQALDQGSLLSEWTVLSLMTVGLAALTIFAQRHKDNR